MFDLRWKRMFDSIPYRKYVWEKLIRFIIRTTDAKLILIYYLLNGTYKYKIMLLNAK